MMICMLTLPNCQGVSLNSEPAVIRLIYPNWLLECQFGYITPIAFRAAKKGLLQALQPFQVL